MAVLAGHLLQLQALLVVRVWAAGGAAGAAAVLAAGSCHPVDQQGSLTHWMHWPNLATLHKLGQQQLLSQLVAVVVVCLKRQVQLAAASLLLACHASS